MFQWTLNIFNFQYNTKTEENEEENVSVANIVPGKGSGETVFVLIFCF